MGGAISDLGARKVRSGGDGGPRSVGLKVIGGGRADWDAEPCLDCASAPVAAMPWRIDSATRAERIVLMIVLFAVACGAFRGKKKHRCGEATRSGP